MRDNLPSHPIEEGCYLYNLDRASSHGTHWTMFCLKRPYLYYVDSFGTQLSGYPPQELRDWARRYQGVIEILANEWSIQDLQSEACGYFCLYFAKRLSH
jgi:hypothetical protein